MDTYKKNNIELFSERGLRHTQNVKRFLNKWKIKELPDKNILYEYKEICLNLLYEEEDLVLEVIDLLKKNITLWAEINSDVYKNIEKGKIIDKQDLLDKSTWYVNKDYIDTKPMATSGSTTGSPFSYLRWDHFLYFIECDNHYDLILDEFEIKEDPNILFFFDLNTIPVNEENYQAVFLRKESGNFMEHHGKKRKANIHYINFNHFKIDQEQFFFNLFKYLEKNEMDVMFTTGPKLNTLCNYIKKNKLNKKIAKLLSNTNERLLPQNVNFIKENKIFDKICDHMRCWDGGATFFTCRDENYHILDNLSWCEEKNKKLISTDYFSFACPFVNYWNGDYCSIKNKYERCDCGRIFRDFEFLENRPFSIKGKNILEIREKIKEFDIKEVRCATDSLEIITNYEIKEENKKNIENIINKLLIGETKISFLVEKFYG